MEKSVARQAAPAVACALSLQQGQLSGAARNAVHPLAGAGANALMIDPAPSARDLRRVARPPLITRLIGRAMAFGYKLAGKDRYDDFRVERVKGVPFIVTPSVFNPKVPRTGEFFASLIDSNLVCRLLLEKKKEATNAQHS